MKAENENVRLERDLDALFTLPIPDPAFSARLQAGLTGAHRTPKNRAITWPVGRWALAAILLAVVMTVLAVGPQKVWAMTVRWLSGTGFNTDVGFAPAGATLELSAPVEARRGMAVFHLDRALFIQGERVTMDYSIEIDPVLYAELEKIPVGPVDPSKSMDEVMPPYTRFAFENHIESPEGLRLRCGGGMAYLENGRLVSRQTYDPPGDHLYTHYKLALPSNLNMLIGAGEGEWVIPFELKPVAMVLPEPPVDPSQPAESPASAPTQPVAPGAVYQPTAAVLPISEFDIQMTDAAVTPQETALRLEVKNREYSFESLSIDAEYIHLRDETGREYARLEKNAQNDDMYHQTIFFEALRPGARQIKLTIDKVYLLTSVPFSCQDAKPPCGQQHPEFTVNLDMQPGTMFEPRQKLDIPGFPGGSLTLERVEILPSDARAGIAIAAAADWSYTPVTAVKLVGVSGNIHLAPGETINGCGGVSHSGQQIDDRTIRENYSYTPIDGSTPSATTFYIDVCAWEVEYSGPWELTWDIPAAR